MCTSQYIVDNMMITMMKKKDENWFPFSDLSLKNVNGFVPFTSSLSLYL